jgi:hypothetical protein
MVNTLVHAFVCATSQQFIVSRKPQLWRNLSDLMLAVEIVVDLVIVVVIVIVICLRLDFLLCALCVCRLICGALVLDVDCAQRHILGCFLH